MANAQNVTFHTLYGSQFTSSTYLIILNYPPLQTDQGLKSSRHFYYYKKIGLNTAVPRTRKKEVYVHPPLIRHSECSLFLE